MGFLGYNASFMMRGGPGGICGDGSQTAGEGCDDGNLTPGDGCNEICQIEEIVGTPCPFDCQPAPNGFVDITDLFTLFGHWEAPGPCDTGLGLPGGGIEELFGMFGAWGPCP